MGHIFEPGPDLSGMLGMVEQELAAAVMLRKGRETNTPIEWVRVFPSDFSGSELIGFCHLCCNGCISTVYPNGVFVAGDELLKRLHARGLSSVDKAPDFMEHFYHTYPSFKLDVGVNK